MPILKTPFSQNVSYDPDGVELFKYTCNNLYYLYDPYEAYERNCAFSMPISVLDIPDSNYHGTGKPSKSSKLAKNDFEAFETEEMLDLKRLHPYNSYVRESFPSDHKYTSREVNYALAKGAWRWTARGHDRLYVAPSALRRDIRLQYYSNGVVKSLRIRRSLINYEESEKVGESVIYYDLKTHHITVFTSSSCTEELKIAARYFFNHIYSTYPIEEVRYMTIPQLRQYAKEFNIKNRSLKTPQQLRRELELVAVRYFTYNQEDETNTMPVYYSTGSKMADCKILQSTADKLVLLHKTARKESNPKILIFDRESGRQLNCKNPRTAKLLWKEKARDLNNQKTVCDSVIVNPDKEHYYNPNKLTTTLMESKKGKPHKAVITQKKKQAKRKARVTRQRNLREKSKVAQRERTKKLRLDIQELTD